MKATRSLILFLAFAFLGILFLVLSTPIARANPGILRVQVNGATSGSCGSTWPTACGLQYALTTRAVSGDELWVAAGTYTPTTGTDRVISFQLRDGIALYGGFAMTETERTQRKFSANVSILSGDIGAQGNADDNSFHVVTGSGVTNTAVLDGFTVKDGMSNEIESPTGTDHGGGMDNNGSPTLSNVTFSNNWAYNGGGMYNSGSPTLSNVTFSSNGAWYGGGIYNGGGSPTLTNVTFSANSAYFDGGGMRIRFSNPTLTNVTFTGNTATQRDGGAIYNGNGGTLTLSNVTFTGNSATKGIGGAILNIVGTATLSNVSLISNTATAGGGIFNSFSSPTLANVTFSSNSATENGGGMYNNECSPTVTNTTFFSNTAKDGGGMYNLSSSPTVANSTFLLNHADYGGGMRNHGGSPTLTNLTFSGNTAVYGGGMYNSYYSSPTLKNVTLSGNSATVGGGAMGNVDSSNPTIRNAILWGNTATSGSQIFNDTGGAANVYDSVVQGGYAGGTNVITTNPLLGPLGDWGGPTKTVPLLYGSSAVDAGDDTNCPPTDQRGVPRLHCDIGAFEGALNLLYFPVIGK